MSLSGTLSLYPLPGATGESDTRPYFTSGDLNSDKAVVFIGGLYNGIGSVPYVTPLSAALEKIEWKMVQMTWTGNYGGFGTGSLDRDVAEMSSLTKHLRSNGTKTIVIMGHSTGSQDVIHYLTSPSYSTREPVQGGIMQAPASDRQFFGKDLESDSGKAWAAALEQSEQLIKEGKGETVIAGFEKTAGCAMSAYRIHSLVGIGGDDDYFSSDIPDTHDPSTPHVHPLAASFGKLPVPALALWSEKDEYGHLPDQTPLLKRWSDAANGRLSTFIVKDGNHAVSAEGPQKDLCEAVVSWVRENVTLYDQ